ncbi:MULTISPECIES: hypothetical protein [Pseudomonas]|jgi:hypothetical protein|uniref:Transcription factor zinc-finger domain-containing protein n=1 Tax=Pseudomonas frederiksbergensis TaxID=104087 RepID=A0A423JHA9_9PSED|nr:MULTISPECIES: hypothetical protein [Pseudomonas]MBV7493514.1 hypothetical protein [Pseudomonas sp. PDM24]RON37071.1 hypothetical protein BK661_01525 [Pseudomonas frederiksbergensis]
MNCPLCGNTYALEDSSYGSGLRIHCEPCGGFYRISTTLSGLAEGKIYDTERARARLKKKRETDELEDQEPALGAEDEDLLVEPN